MKGDFDLRIRVPLLVPAAAFRELTLYTPPDVARATLNAQHGDDLGYEYDWGNLVEETCEDAKDDLRALPVGWGFVLGPLHDEFLDRGRGLPEIASLSCDFLRGVPMPSFLDFDAGCDIAAFEIFVIGEDKASHAHAWMREFFLPVVLPDLLSRLRQWIRAKDCH